MGCQIDSIPASARMVSIKDRQLLGATADVSDPVVPHAGAVRRLPAHRGVEKVQAPRLQADADPAHAARIGTATSPDGQANHSNNCGARSRNERHNAANSCGGRVSMTPFASR